MPTRMILKRRFFATLVLLVSGRALAVEPQQQGIVVWRLEAKTGVTEKDIDSISGFVTAEVERHSGLRVIVHGS